MRRLHGLWVVALLALLFLSGGVMADGESIQVEDGVLVIDAHENHFASVVLYPRFNVEDYKEVSFEVKIRGGSGVSWAPGLYLYWRTTQEWVSIRFVGAHYVVEGRMLGKGFRYRDPSLRSIGSWKDPTTDKDWFIPDRYDWNRLKIVLTPKNMSFYVAYQDEDWQPLCILGRNVTPEVPYVLLGKGHPGKTQPARPYLANTYDGASGSFASLYFDDFIIKVDGEEILKDNFDKKIGKHWRLLLDGADDVDAVIAKIDEMPKLQDDVFESEEDTIPETKDVGASFIFPTLRGERLSRDTKEVEEAYPDRILVIPKMEGKNLSLDGRLDDAVWGKAASLDGFVTIYDGERALSDTQARIFYDDTSLYIGIRCQCQEDELPWGLEKVDLLLNPEPYTPYYSHLGVTAFGGELVLVQNLGPGKAQNDKWSASTSSDKGFWSAEVVIPFAALGEDTPEDGALWHLNLIRDRTGDLPISAWVPIRKSHMNATESSQLYASEARFGSIYFGEGPEGLAPLKFKDVSLEYIGYQEKVLTLSGVAFKSPPKLKWISPSGDETVLSSPEIDSSGDKVQIIFRHPGPVEFGAYVLALESEEGFFQMTFDREALVRAGVSAQSQLVAESSATSKESVELPSPSDTLKRYLDIIPDRTGIFFCYDPALPGYGGQPRDIFKLDTDSLDSMTGIHSKVKYPNDDYPTTGVLKVRNPIGQIVEYPYHVGSDGRRSFLEPHLWWLQRQYMINKTEELSKSSPSDAARLLYRFAQVYPGYSATYDWTNIQYPIEDVGPPYTVSGGLWARWFYSDLLSVAKLARAFDEVRKTDAFDKLSQEVGEDVEYKIEYEMIRASVEHTRTYPLLNHNMDPSIWRGLVQIGKALNEPDYIHEAMERIRIFLEGQFYFDGFWKEAAISYHRQSADGIVTTLNEIAGWSDPEGYISPRDGLNFTRDTQYEDEFPMLKKALAIHKELTYPDGKYLPTQDTWAYSGISARTSSKSFLAPAVGIARLGRGAGKYQTQSYMVFSPKYGHDHYDPLNLIFYAKGQELLPDLGYTHTHYRAWTSSGLAHNTVVVNGSDMSTALGRAGGSLEVFAPIDDTFQVVKARQDNAYSDVYGFARELWLIGFSSEEGYLVDVFRVSGGWRHEYTLQGDANRTSLFETGLPLKDYGPYLLPEGTVVIEPRAETEKGSAGGHYYAYAFVRDVKSVSLPDGRYELTLVTQEGNEAKMKITGFVEPGENELFLGKSPSMKSTRVMNKDTADQVDKFWMPKMVLRREGTDLKSTFVTVMEPYVDDKGALIEEVTLLTPPKSSQGDVAISITHGNTRDILLSSTHPDEELIVEDIVFKGKMGFIREEDGKVRSMYMVGGTSLKKGEVELTSSGPVLGKIVDVWRKALGDKENAFITDVAVPENVKNQYLIVNHPDGTTHGYLIVDVKREGSGSVVILDTDPGFILRNGESRMVYFPFTEWKGEHTFSIECTVSK
jgi:hypothetical protein